MASDKTTVLIVEDEPAIVELVTFSLREAGWNCCAVQSVGEAWDFIQTRTPQLILLDWMLPDQTGLRLLARIRADRHFQEIPVIMLTAKSMEEDKLAGLNTGADDYVTKPFSPRELLARSRALLRRKSPEHAQSTMRAANVALDPVSCTVSMDDQKIDIGHAEYKLLKFLLAHPERVFSRSQLLDKVWGDHVVIEERTVDVHVLRLRKALKEAEHLIKTVRSVGYMLSEKKLSLMNPKLLFWVPAALRTALVAAGCALLGWMFGWMTGIVVALLCTMVMVFVQLSYLYQLSNWMDDPQSAKLPDGWGAWTNIFSRLYRMRRDDEKNQTELTEWLARFRQAMHLLPDGVVIMDDVLFLEWCNPAAEKHLGLTHDRDKGMRVTNLVRNPDFMDYIILGRYEQPLTISFRERKLIVHIIPFENRRQILVTHDATETERIEEMRRDFIANASHELRTPLTVIVGFLEIAASEGLDAATRSSHLKLMTEQGHRMQHLIEDMLTLSRLESVDYPMRPEPVDIRRLMEQVASDARALSAGKHEITLQVDGPDIVGSYEELHSAFGNLASNAVRYTPAGGTINLVWREFEAGVKFKVEDTGIGISPEHISRLTERFYRVDKSRSRETQGTGLGLAIVKHVLLRHGGTLQIKSEAGKGSSFIVCLPKTAIVPKQAELLLSQA